MVASPYSPQLRPSASTGSHHPAVGASFGAGSARHVQPELRLITTSPRACELFGEVLTARLAILLTQFWLATRTCPVCLGALHPIPRTDRCRGGRGRDDFQAFRLFLPSLASRFRPSHRSFAFTSTYKSSVATDAAVPASTRAPARPTCSLVTCTASFAPGSPYGFAAASLSSSSDRRQVDLGFRRTAALDEINRAALPGLACWWRHVAQSLPASSRFSRSSSCVPHSTPLGRSARVHIPTLHPRICEPVRRQRCARFINSIIVCGSARSYPDAGDVRRVCVLTLPVSGGRPGLLFP